MSHHSTLKSCGECRSCESGNGVHSCCNNINNNALSQLPQYMENNIVRFIYLLREEGLRVSTSELIDALQAVQLVLFYSRENFKAALRATLVKNSSDQDLFNRCFDYFFTSPENKEAFHQARQQKIKAQEERLREAEEVFSFRGRELELSDHEKTAYAFLPEKEKQRMQEFLRGHEHKNAPGQEYKPFLESLVKGRLNFWYKQLRREIEEELPRSDLGDEELSAVSDAAGGRAAGTNKILWEDMQHIARKDLPHATTLIRKIARLLVTRISRRYHSSKKRRKLDLRSTIRKSIQHGGVPFYLRYKSARVKKPHLLLICDVSGSMIRYSSFVLQFIYGVNDAVGHIESFVFSDNLERITPYFHQGRDFEETISELLKGTQHWGGGTSLHLALNSLMNKYERDFNKNTIVIIVSDTRTIRYKESLQKLSLLQEQVKDVIWLNTLPQREWDNYTTVSAFKDVVNMFPCNTLSELEKVLSKKLLFNY